MQIESDDSDESNDNSGAEDADVNVCHQTLCKEDLELLQNHIPKSILMFLTST